MPSTKVERAINIATIAAVIGAAVACVQLLQYRHAHPPNQPEEKAVAPSKPVNSLVVGASVQIQAENWMQNGQTAVFVLSTNCHWCSLSAPEFQSMLLYLKQNNLRAVAIFPEDVTAAQSYLASHRLSFDSVKQVNMGRLGVSITPTLLIVDQYGKVAGEWIGKPTDQEIQDFKRVIRPPDQVVVKNGVKFLNADAAADALKRHTRTSPAIVDLDPREDFDKGHIAGAINIQVDEIPIRAKHELPENRPLLIYCHKCASCEAHLGKDQLSGYCDVGRRFLTMFGFDHTTFIMDDLTELNRAGVSVNALAYNGQWR